MKKCYNYEATESPFLLCTAIGCTIKFVTIIKYFKIFIKYALSSDMSFIVINKENK